MEDSKRRRRYANASAPNDTVNLLLLVLLFGVMAGAAYLVMHPAVLLYLRL